MAITVGRLMDTRVLQDAQVVAGLRGLDHRVESVNMMDAPDIVEWIRPHQMLVTTLYNVKDNADALQRLIPELAERGCSAVGIKSRYFRIPSFMYTQANDFALPMIQLPYDMPLGVLSHEITRMLLNRDFLSDQLAPDSEHLWDLVMAQDAMDRVAAYLAAEWKAPVALYDQDHQRLAASFSSMPSSLFDALVEEVSSKWERLHRLDAQAYTLHGHIVERMPLIDHHCYYGELMVIDRAKPTGKTLAFAIQAVSAFYLTKDLRRQDWRHYLQNVAEVLLGKACQSNPTANHDYGRGLLIDAFEFTQAKTYGVILAEVTLTGSLQRLGNHWNAVESLQDAVLMRTEKRFQSYGWNVVAGIIDSQLVFLIAFPAEYRVDNRTSPQRVVHLLESIAEDMANIYAIHIRFSVGNFYSSIRHFAYAYQEARETMRASQENIAIFQPQNVQNFLQYIPEPERKRFVEGVLGVLLVLPPLERNPLLKTLQVFLTVQNQITETAKVLFVHRNTVIYRLRKIEGLLNKSLDDADDVLSLRLALLFLTNLEVQGEMPGESSYRFVDR